VSVLREIRARGTFREPTFADLGVEHVPFDELTGSQQVEGALLDAVAAGSSAAVVGVRGGGKSSVLAWLCRHLPDDHIPIRVPVVGMDDPSDPAVLGSVALGAALDATRGDAVDLRAAQRATLERARADEVTTQGSGRKVAGKLGGGPVPAEVSAELGSLEAEYARAAQPFDRLYGFDRLLGVFAYHGLTPVFVLEDTEAALGAGADDVARDRFFTASLRLLVREVDSPTLFAVQDHFTTLAAYTELRPAVLEVTVPRLHDGVEDALRAILVRRLAGFDLEHGLDSVLSPAALPALAAFYAEKEGSIRHVLAALDVATTAALDSGDERLELGHVRLGIEDWRTR
jgi:hypothetical protein